MAVCRYYLMTARDDQVDALRTALVDLAEAVKTIPGCRGVEILQEQDTPTAFHFIERWDTIEAHKDGGKQLGKDASADVRAVIARPPVSAYLNPVG